MIAKTALKWGVNVLLGIDQLGNAVFGGDPDETISSRLGKLKRRHQGCIPWTRPVSKLADWICERFDPNHTLDAIEDDEGKDAVFGAVEGPTTRRAAGTGEDTPQGAKAKMQRGSGVLQSTSGEDS